MWLMDEAIAESQCIYNNKQMYGWSMDGIFQKRDQNYTNISNGSAHNSGQSLIIIKLNEIFILCQIID